MGITESKGNRVGRIPMHLICVSHFLWFCFRKYWHESTARWTVLPSASGNTRWQKLSLCLQAVGWYITYVTPIPIHNYAFVWTKTTDWIWPCLSPGHLCYRKSVKPGTIAHQSCQYHHTFLWVRRKIIYELYFILFVASLPWTHSILAWCFALRVNVVQMW